MIRTIAQITDLHITTEQDPVNAARNRARLEATLAAIHRQRPLPEAIIASGDLVDRGGLAEYQALRPLLESSRIPLHIAVGNHDRRAPLLQVFGAPWLQVDPDGFVQYVVEAGGLRLVVCDTLDEGREGAGFCERRAAWLARTLDEAPQTAAIVIMHHPPIPSGIGWMDPPPNAPWLARLAAVLAPRPQALTLASGHVHRAFLGVFASRPAVVSPATAVQLTLDQTPLDPKAPDGRELLTEEPPGFALHNWDGHQLVTHFCPAGDYAPAVRFTFPLNA